MKLHGTYINLPFRPISKDCSMYYGITIIIIIFIDTFFKKAWQL